MKKKLMIPLLIMLTAWSLTPTKEADAQVYTRATPVRTFFARFAPNVWRPRFQAVSGGCGYQTKMFAPAPRRVWSAPRRTMQSYGSTGYQSSTYRLQSYCTPRVADPPAILCPDGNCPTGLFNLTSSIDPPTRTVQVKSSPTWLMGEGDTYSFRDLHSHLFDPVGSNPRHETHGLQLSQYEPLTEIGQLWEIHDAKHDGRPVRFDYVGVKKVNGKDVLQIKCVPDRTPKEWYENYPPWPACADGFCPNCPK